MKQLNFITHLSILTAIATLGYPILTMDSALAKLSIAPDGVAAEDDNDFSSDPVLALDTSTEPYAPNPLADLINRSEVNSSAPALELDMSTELMPAPILVAPDSWIDTDNRVDSGRTDNWEHLSFSAIDLMEMPEPQIVDSIEPALATVMTSDFQSTDHGSVAMASGDGNNRFDHSDWQITFWGGPMTDADVGQALIFDVELADSYLIGLAGNRPIVQLNDRVRLEGEVQAFKHFGDQDHLEFTAGVGVRWQVAEPVSLAFFDGLSLATTTPILEEQRADKANPLLNYFALEVEVDVAEDWAIAARIHHRSGVFGLFNGVKRGSNAYLVGVRHRL